MELKDLITVIPIIVSIIVGSIASYYYINKLIHDNRDRKPKFTYERLREHTGAQKITILHPDKLINKISIKIDGKFLPLSDIPSRTERTMRTGEGQNFDVPETVTEDSKVEIIYDKHKIKKLFKDLSLTKDSL